MAGTVAVVTGSNRGIGLAIVRGLCKRFSGDVFITSRDKAEGKEAVALLNNEGLKPKVHQLDVTDRGSIEDFKYFLMGRYNGLDVLVNNAAVNFKEHPKSLFPENVDISLETNYHGLLSICEEFFPILRSGARVVNMTSMVSTGIIQRCSPEMRQRIRSATTADDITEIMNVFARDIKTGKHSEHGWPKTGKHSEHGWPKFTIAQMAKSYSFTKVGITAVTLILQAQLDEDMQRHDLVVNSCCPGLVRTGMNSYGVLTPDEGAETPLYLALLPPNTTSPRGEFCQEEGMFNWKEGEYPKYSDLSYISPGHLAAIEKLL